MKNEFFLHDRVQKNGEPTDWNLGTIIGFEPDNTVLVHWDDDSNSRVKAWELFLVPNAKPATAFAPASDPVEHPAHYTRFPGIEVIQITENLNFNRGSAVKYVCRAGAKDPSKEIEDLRKAAWYLNREIGRLEAAA